MQPIAWGGYPNYVIQNGDKLFWRQWESSSARAGITLFFNPNAQTGTGFIAKDQDGQWINSDADTDFWHYRRVDLSQFAGSSIYDICLVTDGDTGAGPWDVYYTDIAIVSADGTVRPLYNRQPSGQSFSVWGTSGVTGRGYEVNLNTANAGVTPDVSTNYYHEDSLGSARMMTSVDGYPVWKGTYLPFGAEWNPQMSTNNYKFAGMEQDAESGLGHTQFRQYNQTLGRWLTPDPVGGDIMNPQSLNRYAYALNNPTTDTDPTGLCSDFDPVCNLEIDSGGGLCGGFGVGPCGGGLVVNFPAPCNAGSPASVCAAVANEDAWLLAELESGALGKMASAAISGGGGSGGGGGSSAGNRPFLSGDFGPTQPLSLWQLFGPPGTGSGCDFGTCGVESYPGFMSGTDAAIVAGALGEGICIVAEPCGTGEALITTLLFAIANSQGPRQPKFNGRYPGNDPAKSPGPNWEWRGSGPVGSNRGAWYEPSTTESLHPDLQNAAHGPHWDYVDPNGIQYRIYPDSIVPK